MVEWKGEGHSSGHHLEKRLFTFNAFHTFYHIHGTWSLDISKWFGWLI